MRLDAKHEILIENLLDLAENHQHEGLGAIIEMLADLHQNGHQSRFVRALKGLPLFELKTNSRGGPKGGARVYFFYARDEAILINCEVKKSQQANPAKFEEALAVLVAFHDGIKVVSDEKQETDPD